MAKIIAEVGSVHDGSFGNACNLIRSVADSGAWAVKFQHHIASEETIKNAPSPNYFNSEPRYNYFERTAFNKDQWVALRNLASEYNLEFIVSPFSIESANFLESIDISFFKIASGEVTNTPMLDHISKKNIPTILSSGMSTLQELDLAVNILGNNLTTVMQCTSEYPCKHENVGLHLMQQISERYRLPASLSDHTVDYNASLIAAYLGAEYIERHITFSRKMYGSDAKHSLTIEELSELISNINICKKLRNRMPSKNDVTNKIFEMKSIFEKGIYFTKNLSKGHCINEGDICIKKPSNEIPPARYNSIIGQKLVYDVKLDDPVTQRAIE